MRNQKLRIFRVFIDTWCMGYKPDRLYIYGRVISKKEKRVALQFKNTQMFWIPKEIKVKIRNEIGLRWESSLYCFETIPNV